MTEPAKKPSRARKKTAAAAATSKPRGRKARTLAVDEGVWVLVREIVAALADKKADDVVALHVGVVSSLADVFVIASGTSQRRLDTLVQEVLRRAARVGRRAVGSEGDHTGWCLVDFGDVVVHLFDPEARRHYDLERLWLDAPRLAVSD